MKRLIIVFLVMVGMLLSVSCEAVETEYVAGITREGLPKDALLLAQFNGGNFGESKTDETMSLLAKLFKSADIIIIEEVSTKEAGAQAIARLCDALNRTGAKWICRTSDPTVGPGSERYGVALKDSRVVAIPEKPALSKNLRDLLDREPVMVNLRAKGKMILVAGFHLVPTAKKPEREVFMISQNTEEFSGDNLIIVGDFNVDFRKLKPLEMALGVQHQIEGKTSLKLKYDKKGSYLSKAYDNILTRGVKVLKTAIVDTVSYTGSIESARVLSDHFPVVIAVVPQ